MKTTKSTLRSLAVILILILSSTTLSAQHTYKFRDSLGTYKVKFTPAEPNTKFVISPTKPLEPKTHELRLSTSWGATDWGGWMLYKQEIHYVGNKYNEATYYMGPTHYYTLSGDYSYWVNEWFNIGGSLTWVYGCRNMFDDISHRRIRQLRDDYISIMPMVRFAWYRNGIVQLYSSAAIGLGIERSDRYDTREDIDLYCAFDFKFLGLSVGRKWFGFAEVGYGSRGVINVGFGYRFNSKNK